MAKVRKRVVSAATVNGLIRLPRSARALVAFKSKRKANAADLTVLGVVDLDTVKPRLGTSVHSGERECQPV